MIAKSKFDWTPHHPCWLVIQVTNSIWRPGSSPDRLLVKGRTASLSLPWINELGLCEIVSGNITGDSTTPLLLRPLSHEAANQGEEPYYIIMPLTSFQTCFIANRKQVAVKRFTSYSDSITSYSQKLCIARLILPCCSTHIRARKAHTWAHMCSGGTK